MRKLLPSILLLLCVSQISAQEFGLPRTEWGVPDLQAVWKHASIIPFAVSYTHLTLPTKA